jgi:hypothetical protein
MQVWKNAGMEVASPAGIEECRYGMQVCKLLLLQVWSGHTGGSKSRAWIKSQAL